MSTFAGAWEGKPVESTYEEFGKVFRELADLAEEKGNFSFYIVFQHIYV